MEKVVRPVLSDMQIEYFEARSEGRKASAFWVRVRGYWSFWKALAFHLALKTLEALKNLEAIRKISKLG